MNEINNTDPGAEIIVEADVELSLALAPRDVGVSVAVGTVLEITTNYHCFSTDKKSTCSPPPRRPRCWRPPPDWPRPWRSSPGRSPRRPGRGAAAADTPADPSRCGRQSCRLQHCHDNHDFCNMTMTWNHDFCAVQWIWSWQSCHLLPTKRQSDRSSPSSQSRSSHISPDRGSMDVYNGKDVRTYSSFAQFWQMDGELCYKHLIPFTITTILLTREGFLHFLVKCPHDMNIWIGWGNTLERFHIHYNLHKAKVCMHLPWKYQNKTTKQYIICFHFDISWKLWIDIMWAWMIKMYSFI